MVLLPPFGLRPGARRFCCLPGVCQKGRSPGRPGGPAPHDGSRPGWGGGLKVPACLCPSRPDPAGKGASPPWLPLRWGVRLMRAGGRGGRDPAGAPGLPGPFSAPLGRPLRPGGRGRLPARKTAPRASERQCGHVFGGFPPAPRPFPPAPRPFEDLRMPSDVQPPSGELSRMGKGGRRRSRGHSPFLP